MPTTQELLEAANALQEWEQVQFRTLQEGGDVDVRFLVIAFGEYSKMIRLLVSHTIELENQVARLQG
jgi:hypothetical protein